MFDALTIGLLSMLCLLWLLSLARRLRRRTVRDLLSQGENPLPLHQTPTLVRTENELLAAIADVYAGRTNHRYLVRIDATKWNAEDVQNAAWLQAHPHPRVTIEQMKFTSKEG